MSGLYDGFEGYRTPTGEELRAVLTSGLVVLDTNVLINLYRFAEQARDDLLRVLERLDGRLWLPHQVLVEFWRNRDAVLRDPRDTDSVLRSLRRAEANARQALNTWARQVSLPSGRVEEIAGELIDAFQATAESVDAFADRSAARAAKDTADDPLLARLEPRLAGCVGPPFDEEARAAAEQEARRRIEAKEPPGHRDGGKEPALAIGDYFVWEQLLREAARRGGDVLFVTADTKDDWWRTVHDDRRGPQLSLVAELRRRSGGRLFMQTPAQFLTTAQAALGVTVRETSVEQASEVERAEAQQERPGEPTDEEIVEYWVDFLSDNARAVYAAAAEIELRDGPGYSFDDIAAQLGLDYASVRSYHRNSGRTAERWRRETGREPPIELKWSAYRAAGPEGQMRTFYRLPPGIADAISAINGP